MQVGRINRFPCEISRLLRPITTFLSVEIKDKTYLPEGTKVTVAKAFRVKVTNRPKQYLYKPARLKVIFSEKSDI